MGREVELVAVRVMAVTAGLLGLRSKENTTVRPFFSNAVILGIPTAMVETTVYHYVILVMQVHNPQKFNTFRRTCVYIVNWCGVWLT